jgi:hypothetical protein
MKSSPRLLTGLFILLVPTVVLAQPPGKPNPQAPTLNPVVPLGMQRGASIDLTLTGSNLNEPTGVWTSFPAKVTIPTDANNGTNPASLRIKVEVPASAPPGFHWLRVATKRGMSNARLFCLDDLPQVMEAPNNTEPKSAQVLPLPCVVVARVDNEATDYFKITVKAGQRLSFEVLGRRLGSQFDPQLTLLDAATGKELPGGHSNDAPGLQTDARLSYVFKNAGDVLIAIRDVSYRGGADFHYRLRVGDFPCATTPIPLAIKRGTRATIRFAGPVVEGVQPSEVQAPTDPMVETIQVAPRGANGLHGWPVVVHLSDLDEPIEKEPNNDPKQANRLAVPGAITARFEEKDDIDHFVFTAKKGQRLILEAHAVEHLSPTEVYMVLKNDKGAQVQATNPMNAPRLDFTAPADGDYTLVVEHLHSWGGPDETYRITVTPFQPDFSLTLNMDRWDIAPGGKVAIPLFLTRAGYNGPIEVSVAGVKGLSGTVTIPAGPPKPPNQPTATLEVSAADLPPGPLSFVLQCKATIDGKPVLRLASVRGLVSLAMGNLAVPPRAANTQLGMAVREVPPFSLALKFEAPDVQAGKSIPLTITVTRAANFTGEVALSFEGLPAGVMVEPSLRIGATTIRMTLSVPATAKIGPAQVAVVGTTRHLSRDWNLRSAPTNLVIKK